VTIDDAAHHEWIIARADRGHDRVAHSLPGEDLFDEKSTGEKSGERETNQTDDWKQRVAERVAAQNLALSESLETRGADVIGRKHIEKSGALIPRDYGGRQQHQSERGEREMAQSVDESSPESHVVVHHIDRAPNRKERQPIGEGEQCEDCEPEIRHRKEKEGDPTQSVIDNRAAAGNLDEGDEDAEGEAADEGDAHEKQCVRKRAAKDFKYWPLVRDGPTQLTVRERIYVSDELLRQRTVEAVLRAQGLPHGLIDIRIIHHSGEGITGSEVNQREGDYRDDCDDDRRLTQPLRDVAQHPLRGFLTRRLRGRWR